MKSLRYLRGWTSEENVKEEFDKLVIHSRNLHRCVLCCENDDQGNMKIEESNECEHMQLNPLIRYILMILKHICVVVIILVIDPVYFSKT